MLQSDKGYVFTNESCIGCGRCMIECPTDESNISVYKDGRRYITVNSDNCIECGNCIKICSHNARDYLDDTDAFFDALRAGEKISLIVSTGYYTTYGERAEQILGYLKSLGVNFIYDSGYGADISVWLIAKYLKEYNGDPADRPFIINACPVVNAYIERFYPRVTKYIIPIQSAPYCTAIYARKYLGDYSKIAYLSSCIARKREIDDSYSDLISYNVTFDHLAKKLSGVDLSAYSAETNLKSAVFGSIVSVGVGLRDYLASLFSDEEIIVSYDGLDEGMMGLIASTGGGKVPHPFISSLSGCEYGCIASGGTDPSTRRNKAVYYTMLQRIKRETYEKKNQYSSYWEIYQAVSENFTHIDPKDFEFIPQDRFVQHHKVPDHIIDDIFRRMHKSTEELRHVDCYACGYRTCYDMATAVAKGYARIEDCSKYVNDEFRRKLFYDDLTGLYSSAGFHVEGTMLMRSHPEKKYVVCAGNINDLKSINDLYNFNVGSQVIVYVAHTLAGLAVNGGICSRLGGNNFVVVVENTPENIERITSIKYFDCSGLGISMPVTMRFGLCEVNRINDMTRIVNYASFAMEKNTDKSRNTFSWYSEEMRSEIIIETSITSQMRSAKENNEFCMYLQPQYNHSTGGIVGAESLCRWVKQDGTVISPGVFIPIFEKNGFIKELDRFMWESAFRQVRKWLDSGVEPVPISVNISRKSLVDDEIVSVIKEFKGKYEIDPSLLHFEITESAYTENQKDLIERIAKIRDLGFGIAMDDFGSGYSSLNTLKDIPIDILKLDMGFLRGDTNREKGGNIISSVIRMAHSLDLITVAEGVETIQQADFLKGMGCDIIQGYLYARPMPVEKYDELFARSRHDKVSPLHMSKILDFKRFYDNDSSETFIFDNYIGPAAMFDYVPGNLELMKVNDRFVSMLGYSGKPAKDFRQHFQSGLCDKDRNNVGEAIKRVESGEKGVVFMFRYKKPDNVDIIVRSRIWYLGNHAGKSVIYSVCDDVSDLAGYFGQM